MTALSESEHFLGGIDDVRAIQRNLLIGGIIRLNEASEFGERHGFESICNVNDFRERVPLATYEDLRSYVDRMALGEAGVLTSERTIAFFKTSGTLSEPKLIPVTPSFVRDKARAFGIFWHLVHRDHPALQGGRLIANFGDSGSGEFTPGGVEAISETSFWNRRMQMFQRRSGWPLPPVVREITDVDLRYFVVARLAMQGELHGVMCLNPSTLLRLCRTIECNVNALLDGLCRGRLAYPGGATGRHEAALAPFLQAHPERAAKIERALGVAGRLELPAIWPELGLAICWQSNLLEAYLNLVREYLPRVTFRDYITQSSECIMAIPTADGASGGLLAYTSHFFEFIPEGEIDSTTPDTLLAGELELGQIYEIICTTSAGLYRYRMGDCVRVIGFRGQVPEIEFLYRHGKTSSITGEKLTEYQVVEAVRCATSDCGDGPAQFACFPRSGRNPHYGVLMTWSGTDGETDATVACWVRKVDETLKHLNTEYSDKRESGRLGPVVGLLTDAAGFERYRLQSARPNVSDEQVKVGGLDRTLDLEKTLPILREVHADNEV